MKKLLSILLCITIMFSCISVLASSTDDEIELTKQTAESNLTTSATSIEPSDWASADIEQAIALNIINVGGNYNFPAPITREEFCELIYNLISNYSQTDLPQVTTIPLADTSNEKIRSLYSWGIVNGKGTFTQEPVISPEDGVVKRYPTLPVIAPNDYLTREETATIIIRMVNKFFPMPATEMWFEYDDIDEISEWASDSVQTISNLGFMKGVGENKFAPKDTYTTEQAIVTLVRVLEGAGASGLLDENTSIGIIGGADGPTSIIVGDNVNVIEKEEYDKFYVEVQTKTTKVDDFYIDEAIKLVTESGELAADKEFISYYTSSKDMTNKVLSIGAVQYSKPTEIYYMAANREQIIENIKALSDEELDGFDIEKLLKLNKVDFSVIGNMINASYGAENLAALTILTNSRGYVMPKDFSDDFALYLQYDGEYSALVSFSKFGDGVIKATMSFINNGDKDNIFRRVFEITQGLGEDSIDVALVK